jgi:hypothetical protein
MKAYHRGYRPKGAITRASCLRRMRALQPKMPRPQGLITRGRASSYGARSVGITARDVGEAVGRRMAKSGVRFGKAPLEVEDKNIDAYRNIMRGAGFAIRKADLKR